VTRPGMQILTTVWRKYKSQLKHSDETASTRRFYDDMRTLQS